MTTVDFAGARWWAFDFHTHTPASSDYGRGPNQTALKGISPQEWLLAFMRNRIDCVAVTDHNSGEWIDRLKAALADMAASATPPSGYRPLALFPGVEITANGGTHVLAIFRPEARGSDITRLLGEVEYRGQDGDSEVAANRSVIEIVSKIREAGALAILAHVDRDRGAFQLTGNTLRPILQSGQLAAIELTDRSATRPAMYTEMNLGLSEVLGSDSHHPDGMGGAQYPGSHFTWIKMEHPSLEGLSLALLDGTPLSVRRSDEFSEADQNRLPTLMIDAIEISNAYRCGLGQALHARFSPWLSAVVGGRGSGKSTILEMMRIALRREGEVPKVLENDFASFKRIAASRNDRGMLRSDTVVKVTYRKDGATFRVRWSQSGEGPVITDVSTNGQETEVPGDVRSRFPIRLFSQKQIFTMAENQDALLRVIDESDAVNRSEWQIRWDQEEKHYLSLMAQCRELDAQASQISRIRGELDDVVRRLSVFEGTDHAELRRNYQSRQRQFRVIEEWRKRWSNAEEQIAALAQSLIPPEIDGSGFATSPTDIEAGALELLDEAQRELGVLSESLRSLVQASAAKRSSWEQRRDGSTWQAAFRQCEEEYGRLVARLQEEGVENPAQHSLLVQQRQDLERSIADLERIERSRIDINNQAHESLGHFKRLRQELTRKRASFVAAAIGGNRYVSIKVLPYQPELSVIEPAFRTLINRANDEGFAQEILVEDDGRPQAGILGRLLKDLPDDADAAAAEVEGRLDSMKENLIAAAKENDDVPVEIGKRLSNHLKKLTPEQCDRIRTWYPDDGLQVSYSAAGTGTDFHPIEQASPGQKTAAILAFVMAYGSEPLVLDQPEDDLDNRLIYELIVQGIRESKVKRQVIVVTHNPNIVVNGDAEKVIEMSFRRGQCVVAERGSLQSLNIRKAVCRVMEGGVEAFKKRYQRIAIDTFRA
jgi:ABC-type lipoprotein export system ATPase subunit